MKKLFLSLFAVCCAFTACSDGEGNDPKEIVLDEGTQTSQTIYADETANKGEGIKFTTTGPWTAEVTEVATRAEGSNVEWLKLNQYSGDKAGDYTLTLTLTENLTGADRKATIKIICGSTTITITVEQKGKKEDGSEPDNKPIPTAKKLLSKLRYTREYDEHGSGSVYETEITFTYDDKNRVIEGVEIDYKKDGTPEEDGKVTWIYSDNTITQKQRTEESDYISEDEIIYTLDDSKKVMSWIEEVKEVQGGNQTTWKGKGIHHYDENNYLITVDIATESKYGEGNWHTSYSTDFCEWQNGNLVKVGEKENSRAVTLVEYGDVDNIGNLDLNFLLANTEWLDCLAFEEMGIKPFGYIGKRSAKLMAKETDLHNNNYCTYEYSLNEDRTVGNITMIGHEANGTIEFRRVYTLTYIAAQ